MLEIIQSLTAIIAVIISVCTLKQNSKQIEESTRPYITIYLTKINLGTPSKILVIKNFGKSSAKITKLSCDEKLIRYSCIPNLKPFSSIEGSSLVPNQSYKCLINPPREKDLYINFEISYTSNSNKNYNEKITIKLDAERTNVSKVSNSSSNEENKIFQALQQMIEQNL